MIVLDTHAWLWWVNGSPALQTTARARIEDAVRRGRVVISSISVWEVQRLAEQGRLRLRISVDEWVQRCERIPFIEFMPIDNQVATRAVALPGTHTDPIDRMIVATALALRLPLVSYDRKLWHYEGLEIVT